MNFFKNFLILAIFIFNISTIAYAEVPFYFGDEKYPIKQQTLLLDSENSTGNIIIQFGNSLGKMIGWLTDATPIGGDATGQFYINDGVGIYEDNNETNAGLGLTIANNGTGDSILQLLINGAQRWVLGIDNSDSDKFKISSSQDLNSNAILTIDTNGNTGLNDTNPTSPISIRPSSAIGGGDYLFKGFQTPTQDQNQPSFGVVGDGSIVMAADTNPVWFGVYNGGLIFAGNYYANTEIDFLDIVGNTYWGSQAPNLYGMSSNTAVLNASTGNFQTDGNISVDGSNNYLLGDTGIGTNTPGSKLDVKGSLRLSGSNSGYVGFSPATDAGSTTYTLPTTDGSTGQVLTTNGTGSLSWSSAAGGGSGDITSVGSMTSGDAFSDATADDDWLGLGALAGRIEFDDQTTDEVNILNANVGIGTSTPSSELEISTTDGTLKIGSAFPNKSASTDTGISMYNALSSFKSGLFTEVDGALLSYGINISQLGDRDTTKIGGIFRMDTRDGNPYFSVKRQAIGGNTEYSDMQISQDGNIGFGGWANDTNSFPANVSILSRATGIIGLLVRGASGQTADLQQWQNNAGTILASLTATGLLDISKTGEAIEIGAGTASDSFINFDDGTDRNFGWDDNYSANHPTGTISTFNNELAFRTIQSTNTPSTCSSTIAGMQWMDTDTGMSYICDTSNGRNKWLTLSDTSILGEQSGTCNAGTDVGNNVNCSLEYGSALGNDGVKLGIYIPHPITITGYGFSEDNDACSSGSFDIELWSTGSNSNDNSYTLESVIASGLTGETHNSNNLNINANGDQYINIGLDNNCGQSIDDFSIILYYRYRHN